MNLKRNTTLDFLRGLAMILIILIHVTVYYRNNALASVLWEYSQVAVHIFIFCSAYLYFSKTKVEHFSITYFWKRTKRLVVPYYAYLIALFLYTLLLKKVPVSFESMIRKIFFMNISSRDLDWLVVLFLYFMILMPLIRILGRKPILFWLYTVMSITSATLLLFLDTAIAFRLAMWLPWSLLLIVSYLVVRYEYKKWVLPGLIVTFLGIHLISKAFLIGNGDTLTLTENKYPPNIFYISYGVWIMLAAYMLHLRYHKTFSFIQPFFDYFSNHSYSIFFIHFLVLYYFLDFTAYRQMPWWGLFAFVITLTIVIQKGVSYLFSILKRGPTI